MKNKHKTNGRENEEDIFEILQEQDPTDNKEALKQAWKNYNEQIEELEKKCDKLRKKNQPSRRAISKGVRVVTPVVASIAITYKAFTLCDATPFIKDNVKEYAQITKEGDTFDNISYSEEYVDSEDKEATIAHVGKWKKGSDGNWKRKIKIYSVGKIGNFRNEIDIEKLKSLGINSLDMIFGEPILEQFETKNNITAEEKEEDAYLKATIYYEDDSKSMIVKESKDRNFLSTTLFLIFSFLSIVAGTFSGLDTELKAKNRRNQKLGRIEDEVYTLTNKKENIKKELESLIYQEGNSQNKSKKRNIRTIGTHK